MANEGMDRILAALEASERVDATRIELEIEDGTVVITGAVASAEQATLAETVVAQFSDNVSNNLRVDRGLREGVEQPTLTEQVTPAEGEVLIGSTDMLAGPEAEITDDISIALQENVPWDPPMEPTLAPTAAEYGGDVSMGDGGTGDHTYGGESAIVDPSQFSAPDLTKEDLEAAAQGAPLPSLDPDYVATSSLSEEAPLAMDPLGAEPPEDLGEMPDPVPGASARSGPTGDGTVTGGGIGGEPALETGALGVDTQAADPVHAGTGGSMTDSGTPRGPAAPDEPALREDFPTDG